MSKSAPPTGERLAMRLLLGDWHPLVRDPIDLLRLAILAGGIYGFAAGSTAQGARFVLTFLVIAIVPRVLNVPRPFDLWFVVGMSLQAWGNIGDPDAFMSISWYDELVHAILTGAIASLIYIGLVRLSVIYPPESPRPAHSFVGTFIAATTYGMAVGVLYEIYEFADNHTFGNGTLHVGYADTIYDLIFDTCGGAVAGLALVLWAWKGWSSLRRRPERAIEREQAA